MNSKNFESLMTAQPSEKAALALIAWASEMKGRVERGDLTAGILSVEEVAQIPLAYRQAALWGIKDAWLALAFWHLKGPLEPNLLEGEAAFVGAFESGMKKAALALGESRWFDRRDDATPQEREETYRLLKAYSDEAPDDSNALFLLGLLVCAGFGTPADPKAAFELQKRAAEMGHSKAAFELYVHYKDGIGTEQDDFKAFEANMQAAQAGNARAMYNAGTFYANGHFFDQDMSAAAECYSEAAARGHALAAGTLAAMYAQGQGIDQDLEAAQLYLQIAEELGLDEKKLEDIRRAL